MLPGNSCQENQSQRSNLIAHFQLFPSFPAALGAAVSAGGNGYRKNPAEPFSAPPLMTAVRLWCLEDSNTPANWNPRKHISLLTSFFLSQLKLTRHLQKLSLSWIQRPWEMAGPGNPALAFIATPSISHNPFITHLATYRNNIAFLFNSKPAPFIFVLLGQHTLERLSRVLILCAKN